MSSPDAEGQSVEPIRYRVKVPRSLRAEIATLELPAGVAEQFYANVRAGVEYGHEQTCLRLAGGGPTFIYRTDVPDPVVPTTLHLFTAFLTYGPREATLYLAQVSYDRREGWVDEDEGASE